MRKSAALVVGLCVLLITPYFVLRVVKTSYSFTASQLREAVEGTWQVELAEGERLTFRIEQARDGGAKHSSLERGWIRSAAACDNRTLIRSAEACLDETTMPLTLTEVAGAPTKGRGELVVIGTTFEVGDLELEVGRYHIAARISPTGDVVDLVGSARALVRVSR